MSCPKGYLTIAADAGALVSLVVAANVVGFVVLFPCLSCAHFPKSASVANTDTLAPFGKAASEYNPLDRYATFLSSFPGHSLLYPVSDLSARRVRGQNRSVRKSKQGFLLHSLSCETRVQMDRSGCY